MPVLARQALAPPGLRFLQPAIRWLRQVIPAFPSVRPAPRTIPSSIYAATKRSNELPAQLLAPLGDSNAGYRCFGATSMGKARRRCIRYTDVGLTQRRHSDSMTSACAANVKFIDDRSAYRACMDRRPCERSDGTRYTRNRPFPKSASGSSQSRHSADRHQRHGAVGRRKRDMKARIRMAPMQYRLVRQLRERLAGQDRHPTIGYQRRGAAIRDSGIGSIHDGAASSASKP